MPLLIFTLIAISAALIWVCVRSVNHDRELKKLRQDLYHVADTVHERKREVSSPSPASGPVPRVQPTYPAAPAASQPMPPVQPAYPAAPAAHQPMPPVQPAYPAAPAAAQPMPPVQPAYPAAPPAPYTPPTPVYGYPSPPRPQPKPKEKSARTLETWLGRNVLGIAASVLVFIGLIFLGVLVYKNITDTIKILLMYALSGLLTGLGLWLSVKGRNNFTLALTGCGCGSFFISILLTHIYFGKIPELAAFGLLLLWMIATLFIARGQRSTLLSAVAHAGMILSLCFAFAQGISDEKLVLVLVYQVAASAVILIGNIFCCRKTYHFGLFASLILTLTASGFMLARFIPRAGLLPFRSALPVPAIAAAFVLQFVMASVFSYLLAVSASRFEHEEVKVCLHLFNKALWATALCANVYAVAYRLTLPHFSGASDWGLVTGIPLLACLLPLIVHVILTLIMRIKLRFSQTLECISVLTCFLLTAVFLLLFWCARMLGGGSLPRLPWLLLPALALFLVRRFSRRTIYWITANVLLGLDFLFTLFGGYARLVRFGTPALALGWMLLYAAVILGEWVFRPPEDRQRYLAPLRILLYISVMLSLGAILQATNFFYPNVIIFSIFTGLHFLLLLLRYDRGKEGSALTWLLGLVSLLLLTVDTGLIAFADRHTPLESGLYFLLTALTFCLTFVRVPDLIRKNSHPARGVLTGVVFTLLILAAVQGNTDWFAQSYVLSLTCMLAALACILTGFAAKVSSLRLYGLILTLVCVLKLVTLDVVNLSTLLRVIALIGGGVICFIVSAIYNYTVKQLSQSQEPPPVAPNEENPS